MSYVGLQKIGITVFSGYSPPAFLKQLQSHPFTSTDHHPEFRQKEKENLPNFNFTFLSPISGKDITSIKIAKDKKNRKTTTTMDLLTIAF